MPPAKPKIISFPIISIKETLFTHYPSLFDPITLNETPDATLVKVDNNIEDVSVSQIMHEKSSRYIYFYDIHKTPSKVWITFHDLLTGELPIYTDKHCWWDHHQFNTSPIGCPLEYDHQRDCFLSEGLFCSFPCVLAYITEKLKTTKDNRYRSAATNISLVYRKIYGLDIKVIQPAPKIDILKAYNGHLSIEEYRSSFGKLIYEGMKSSIRPAIFYPLAESFNEIQVKV
jgi:hypothetical protein